jgi:5-formyltetrahydrofolate cyclo-ligase
MPPFDSSLALKQEIRRQARRRRDDQPDKEGMSRIIWERFFALPEYAAAETVMLYVDARSEVRTRPFLPGVIAAGKRVVVPYCVEGDLELFHLEGLEELAPGYFGIQEPRPELRPLPGKRVEPGELGLVMVPGLAFDRRGGRMGYGRGYYDRLLHRTRRDTRRVAVAFECQLFPAIPMLEHDLFMDTVITEKAIYEGRPQ